MFRRKINDYISLVKNKTETGEILIYGDIMDNKWYDEAVTPKSVLDALNEIGKASQLDVRVNSYGGSVFAGNAIFNIIDNYREKNKCNVTAYIDGIGASMGSGIPMVANKIIMHENSMLMVHRPLSFACGNVDDLEEEKRILNQCEKTLISNYMRHFNGTEDEMKALLVGENGDGTWLTADEALECGLCDEIIVPMEISASAKGVCINGIQYNAELLDKIKAKYPTIKIKEESEENNLMKYDKKLLDSFGISKEDFEAKYENDSQAFVNFVCENTITTAKETLIDISEVFITNETAKEKFGDLSVEDIETKLKDTVTVTDEEKKKVLAYDKIVKDEISNALKLGVGALGEKFDDQKWEKHLSNCSLDEIKNTADLWQTQKEIALNAGKRISDPSLNTNFASKEPINVIKRSAK